MRSSLSTVRCVACGAWGEGGGISASETGDGGAGDRLFCPAVEWVGEEIWVWALIVSVSLLLLLLLSL